jgi:enamine deaminase RidA (YjgF/YER057c/UK114 family)
MDLERINPAELARPSGFSHAVSVPVGRMVFLSGQIGMDREGKLVTGGIGPQFEQALANLLAALAQAGGHPSDLVSVTMYLTDVAGYQDRSKEIGALWRRLAGTDYPAMAAVGVTRLWLPDALVEIQGIAVVGAEGVSR